MVYVEVAGDIVSFFSFYVSLQNLQCRRHLSLVLLDIFLLNGHSSTESTSCILPCMLLGLH